MNFLLLSKLSNEVIERRLYRIFWLSLQTVSELVGVAGSQLKPSLPLLIPALIQATGDLESSKLSYLSNIYGGSQTQEAIDSARAQIAKSHFTTETVSKVR